MVSAPMLHAPTSLYEAYGVLNKGHGRTGSRKISFPVGGGWLKVFDLRNSLVILSKIDNNHFWPKAALPWLSLKTTVQIKKLKKYDPHQSAADYDPKQTMRIIAITYNEQKYKLYFDHSVPNVHNK